MSPLSALPTPPTPTLPSTDTLGADIPQLALENTMHECIAHIPGIIEMPVPGRRCPACLERGDTVWVIPGKCCPQCGTLVN